MSDRYDALGFYHDSSDPRLFVPKKTRWMGWTINAEHPYGKLVLAATGALVAAAISAAFTGADPDVRQTSKRRH